MPPPEPVLPYGGGGKYRAGGGKRQTTGLYKGSPVAKRATRRGGNPTKSGKPRAELRTFTRGLRRVAKAGKRAAGSLSSVGIALSELAIGDSRHRIVSGSIQITRSVS